MYGVEREKGHKGKKEAIGITKNYFDLSFELLDVWFWWHVTSRFERAGQNGEKRFVLTWEKNKSKNWK